MYAAVWPQMASINRIVDAACRQYAFEGQTFVVVAGAIMTDDTVQSDFILKAETRLNYNGGSAIIDPAGKYLVGPAASQQALSSQDRLFPPLFRQSALSQRPSLLQTS